MRRDRLLRSLLGTMTGPPIERFGLNGGVMHPAELLALLWALAPVGSLLAYFYGLMTMAAAFWTLVVPAVIVLLLLWHRARRHSPDLALRIGCGFWAGSLATLAYDLVRVPVAHAGVPV